MSHSRIGMKASLDRARVDVRQHYDLFCQNNSSPSRSMSYSCAIASMSSPSLASIVLIRLPSESLKWTLILGSNPIRKSKSEPDRQSVEWKTK